MNELQQCPTVRADVSQPEPAHGSDRRQVVTDRCRLKTTTVLFVRCKTNAVVGHLLTTLDAKLLFGSRVGSLAW